MSDFVFNDETIDKALKEAWREVAKASGWAAREAIGLKRYEYPRVTRRKSGEIAGSPRTKVDSGYMQSRQRLEIIDDENFALINDAEYSGSVHEGQGDRPPQEWLKEAISAGDDGAIDWQNPNALVNIPREFARAFHGSLSVP